MTLAALRGPRLEAPPDALAGGFARAAAGGPARALPVLDTQAALAFRDRWSEEALPADGAADEDFVQGVAHGLFGLVPGEEGAALGLAPWLPAAWREMALRRWRAGRTVLDVEVRRRPSGLLVRVVKTFGPALPLRLALRGPDGHARRALVLDDVPLGQPVARFRAEGRHEALFL